MGGRQARTLSTLIPISQRIKSAGNSNCLTKVLYPPTAAQSWVPTAHSQQHGYPKALFSRRKSAFCPRMIQRINSSIRTSVKGVAHTDNRIWDTAEYTIPMQLSKAFYIGVEREIFFFNHFYVIFFQYPFPKAICSSDKSCEKGSVDINSHGIQTGRCVYYNATVKTCEVRAWCPVESMENPPELNIPQNLNTSCTYNKITSPLCPIFRLGDILQEAKENFSEMAVKGGIIAIEINWDCNLDRWFYDCHPEYGFRRLDDKKIKPGFQFRYAKYYKLPNGKEQRTLFKVYGIRFDVLVFGTVNAILFPCGGRRKLAISLTPLLPYTALPSPVHHSGTEVMSDE
uniref:Purinergic receptor P2X 7 n=1 Tax=Strix occidentalis caurina TaxID=311401 RepID=A0A8D0KXR3_STROC